MTSTIRDRSASLFAPLCFNLRPPQYETGVHQFCTPCVLTCDLHNTREECITFCTPCALTCDLHNTRQECITFCTPCVLTCDLHNTRQECITCPCHSTVLTINRRISDKVVFVILDKHVRCEMCETVLERRVPRLTPHLSAAGLRENCRT